MSELNKLKEHIRGILLENKKAQKREFIEQTINEYKLRKTIRKMLKEAEDIVTHESTGINVLADLLETIVPILKSFYKKLGTDIQQRKSFRAHIIKSVQNMLAPISVMFRAGGQSGAPPVQKPEVPQNELVESVSEEVKINVPKNDVDPNSPDADPAYIPLKADRKEMGKQQEEKPQDPKADDYFVEVEGEDETGRNIALQAFKRVEKQTREAFSILANEDDRNLFYDYLITNLKLYFDKFEDELQTMVPEPTTQEYEAEKGRKDAALTAGTPTQQPGSQQPASLGNVPSAAGTPK